MSDHNIPEVLRDAARIFLVELEGHVDFIRNALGQTQTALDPAALQRRFHLIRGASGFLGMKALHTIATEAEHLFRDQGVSLSPEELRNKTITFLGTLESQRIELSRELAK